MKINLKTLILIQLIALVFPVGCNVQEPILIEKNEVSSEPYWDFYPNMEFVGYVVPTNDYYLSFPTSGQIFELNAQEGDVVSAGELIAVLDSTAIRADIARAEVDLELAKAELEKSKLGSHPALIEEAESIVELAEAEAPIGIAQAAAQVANIKGAKARLEYLKALPLPEDVALAEVEVNRQEVALEDANLRLNQTVLIAPIDGTILQIYIKKFEYAGTGSPVVRLSDLDDLQVEFIADNLEIGGIKVGDKALITFDVLPGVEIVGEVIYIQPENLDRMSGNFIVTLGLTETPETISLGMSANIVFQEDK